MNGKIIDTDCECPIPGATVLLYDSNGNYFGNNIASGSGNVVIARIPGGTVRVSAAEYGTVDVPNDFLQEGFTIDLERLIPDATSTPVVVTSHLKKNNTAIYAGLGLLLLATVDSKKKKSVSGVYDYYKGIPPLAKGAIFLAGGYLIYRLITRKPPQGQQLPDAANSRLEQLKAAGVRTTWTASQAQAFASKIFEAVDGCGTDENAIFSVFDSVENEADLQTLIIAYGVRNVKACFDGDYFGGTPRNLSESLTADLSDSDIQEINTILQHKAGISFNF